MKGRCKIIYLKLLNLEFNSENIPPQFTHVTPLLPFVPPAMMIIFQPSL